MAQASARVGGMAAILATVVLVAGCAGHEASVAPSVAPSLTATHPPASSSPTLPADAARTFPPSQTPIAPGTYRWSGFEHPITVDLGAGWALGHDNPAFFDLFRGSDFPAISFARFSDLYVDAKTRAAATDAASVLATLKGRVDMTLTDVSAIDLAGLHGQQFDLATLNPRTPVFFGPAGDFQLDPEFKTRYRVLDFPGGGVLVIGVHDHVAQFVAAVALCDPVVATLTVEP